jgi:cyclophilin family peptidyl-prolyl cis-trans isomerase
MVSPFKDTRAQLIIGAIVVAVAAVLAISKYKLPIHNINFNFNTNNTNQSTMGPIVNTSYPFANLPLAEVTGKQVRIKTDKGDIVFRLDPVAGPLAAKNFYYLARKGFYDGLTWQRVVSDFVIQGGDPTGTGRGGPGYSFPDDPVNQAYADGSVAMANSGVNTNGSQFFICKGSLCQTMAPSYSIFGQVTEGMSVVKAIAEGDRMLKVTIEPAA